MYSAISLRTPSLPLGTAALYQMQPLAAVHMAACAFQDFKSCDGTYFEPWCCVHPSAGEALPTEDAVLYSVYIHIPGEIMDQRFK